MDEETPSKTRRKRQMEALQDLGERLVALNQERLAQMDLPDSLRAAVEEARRIRSHGALRRQMQYFGKLMRSVDPEPIRARFNREAIRMNLSEKIIRWIWERVKQAGSAGVVVGLSGGIDSAVAAVLAQKALGENVLALVLPCRSLPEDERDALFVADLFCLPRERLDLAPVYDAFLRQLPSAGKVCQANSNPA